MGTIDLKHLSSCLHFLERKAYLCYECLSNVVPVSRCGEHPQDDVPAMHPDDGTGGVEQVKVEVGITGDGAVQPGLQERRPLLLKDALGTALVPFTHPGHT